MSYRAVLFVTLALKKTFINQSLAETCQVCSLKTKTEGKPRLLTPACADLNLYSGLVPWKSWLTTGCLSFLVYLLVREWLNEWANEIHHMSWIVRIPLLVKLPVVEAIGK